VAATDEKPKAGPIYRWIALGIAVFSFVLAGVFAVAPDGNKLFAVGTFLFLGFVYLMIARTGLWPPPRDGR
jgi:hypothetical protein